tara:strand:- start:1269 stop:1391 length:123 start_codon:yes stop_codon:yes gene_type:complete
MPAGEMFLIKRFFCAQVDIPLFFRSSFYFPSAEIFFFSPA